MVRVKPNSSRRQIGASVIEFGLVAFVFFLILWGIFDFARSFYVRNSAQHLTRCIARAAVVREPTQTGALAAKQECLMEMTGSPGNYFWPFFEIGPADMTNLFIVRYCRKADDVTDIEGCSESAPVDQVTECLDDTNDCVKYVRVYMADATVEEFGLVRSWLGIGGSVKHPYSATTMPAESMGFVPP